MIKWIIIICSYKTNQEAVINPIFFIHVFFLNNYFKNPTPNLANAYMFSINH